jgi:hypothetical protein
MVMCGKPPGPYREVTRKGAPMPIFMVERQFAEALETPEDGYAGLNRINEEEEVRWLMSFLSADKRKTYCSTRPSPPRRS